MTKASGEDKTNNRSINILLVEDSQADIKIALRAFKEVIPESKIYVVGDGEEALDFIYHKGTYQDREKMPVLDLILLDINMPKMDGFQVLENIKNDPKHKAIPVIVLTSSRDEEDRVKSYKNGASNFVSKPISYKDFLKVVEGFYSYIREKE